LPPDASCARFPLVSTYIHPNSQAIHSYSSFFHWPFRARLAARAQKIRKINANQRKSAADFMLASAARQRTIIRDSKFPKLKDGKMKPQIVRYSEARAAIRDYHEAGNDITVLLTAVERLTKKKADDPNKDAARLDDNIRAINTYMKYFSKNPFTVLTTPKPIYRFEQVEVSATPDLYVEENGVKKLIRLDFNQQKPREEAVDIVMKVMYEAGSEAQLGVKPKDVIYLDVSRQVQYTGKKLNKGLKKNIDAALATIQDMWANIKQEQ
jgi:hypothetical protein